MSTLHPMFGLTPSRLQQCFAAFGVFEYASCLKGLQFFFHILLVDLRRPDSQALITRLVIGLVLELAYAAFKLDLDKALANGDMVLSCR